MVFFLQTLSIWGPFPFRRDVTLCRAGAAEALELATRLRRTEPAGVVSKAFVDVERSCFGERESHLVDSVVLYHMFSGKYVVFRLSTLEFIALTLSRDQKERDGAFFEKRKPDLKATLEED